DRASADGAPGVRRRGRVHVRTGRRPSHSERFADREGRRLADRRHDRPAAARALQQRAARVRDDGWRSGRRPHGVDGGDAGRGSAPHASSGGVAFVPMTEELPGPPRVLLPERLVDVGLAVGLALVVIIAETFGERTATDMMAEIVLGVGGALALLERRRRPMAVLAMNAAIVATEGLLALRVVSAPTLLVALYTVCARRPRDEGLKAAGIALVAMLVQVIHTTDSPVGNAVSAAVSVAAATGIGLYMGTRRQYVEALRERALQLARERALEAHSALAEERARIARELHDVVAHHVTLMVVQAGALRETLPA